MTKILCGLGAVSVFSVMVWPSRDQVQDWALLLLGLAGISVPVIKKFGENLISLRKASRESVRKDCLEESSENGKPYVSYEPTFEPSKMIATNGSDVLTVAPVITRKWGEIVMEHLAHARDVFRGMWKWPELWGAILVGAILVRLIVNAGTAEQSAVYNRNQIEAMKTDAAQRFEENKQSVADRHWIHEELSNAKSALRRLERTVKTGEYP